MKIKITQHALEQMFKRDISVDLVKQALTQGEVIKSYADDKPYPSKICYYNDGKRPIHVVFAINSEDQNWIVITAYEPDVRIWRSDFKTKK